MTTLHDSAIMALRGLLAATDGDIYTDAPECAGALDVVAVARDNATDVLAWADREAEQERAKALQDTARRLVSNDVHYSVSSLIHTLSRREWDGSDGVDQDDLIKLSSRQPDADDYSDQMPEGWGVALDGRPDRWGFYGPEGECDDGQGFASELDAWRAAAEEAGQEVHGSEIYEHWLVSDWLAAKLEAKGETVVRNLCGLTIWGRATTGQAIYIDGVIEAIARDLVEA
jgi:hypothetical protein